VANDKKFIAKNGIQGLDASVFTSITTSGSVGVGTASPVTGLDVNGDARVRGTTTTDQYLYVNSPNGTQLQLRSEDAYTTLGAGNRNLNITANRTIFLDDAFAEVMRINDDGNVGIGIATPALQSGGTGLHIHGSSYSEIKLTNTTSGTGANDGVAFVTANNSFTLNNRSPGSIFLRTNNTLALTITAAQLVDFAGDIKLTDSKIAYFGVGNDLQIHSDGTNSFIKSPTGDLSIRSSDLLLQNANGTKYFEGKVDATHGTHVNLYQGGGIKLQTVSGGVYVSGDVAFSNGDGIISRNVAGATRTLLTLDTTNRLRIKGNAPEAVDSEQGLTLIDNGNVGIGILAPATALHVRGTASTVGATRSVVTLTDDTAMGINVGSGVAFRGLYTSAGTEANYGGIFAGKANANSGNANGYLSLSYSASGTLTEGIRISETGKVGIGTATPSTKLDLSTSGADGITLNADANNATLSSRLFLNNGTAGKAISIMNNGNNLSISTAATPGSGSGSEKVRILENGNVGIGTAAPDAKLDIKGDFESTYALKFTNTKGTGKVGGFRSHGTNGNDLTIYQDGSRKQSWASSEIKFYGTSNAEIMRIENGGNVGIGTATPSNVLHVHGSDSGITVSADASDRPHIRLVNGTAEMLRLSANNLYGAIGDSSDSQRYMVFKNDFIGTNTQTAPNAQIHIGTATAEGTATNPALQIGGANTYRLGFYTEAELGIIDAANGDNGLAIHTKTIGEAVRIDADGQVGIGTNNPHGNLHIYGNNTRTIFAPITANLAAQHRLEFWEGTVSATNSTDANYAIEYDGTATYGGDGALLFRGSGSANNQMYAGINRQGTTFLGMEGATPRVGIGTTNPTNKLDIRGNVTQIDGSPEYHFATTSATHYNWRLAAQEQVSSSFEIASGELTAGTSADSDTYTNRFVINANGNIGIGTNSPDNRLHVHAGTSSDIVRFANDNGSFILGKTGNLGSLDMAADANFRIRHGSVLSATFKSNGDVGIGTASPRKKLDVFASDVTNGTVADNATAVIEATEAQLQIIGEDSGSWASNITLTNAPATGDNKHWTMHHTPASHPTVSNALQFNYVPTNIGGSIGGDGTGASYEAKMTITNAGNVGIGTETPPSPLTVQANGIGIRLDGTANTTRRIFFRSTSAANPAEIYADGTLRLWTEDAGTDIKLEPADDVLMTPGGQVRIQTNSGLKILTATNNPTDGAIIYFSDNIPAEGQNGFIKYKHADGSVVTGSNEQMVFGGDQPVSDFLFEGDVHSSGDVVAYFSDPRLKDFHGNITGALDKVNSLGGYYFTENELAKEIGYRNDRMQVGVNAEEVEAVLPEVVTTALINENIPQDKVRDYKTVKYEKMVPLLIEAIKELTEQNMEMKQRLNRLEGEA
jgi:hypothetical protein